MRSLKSRIGWCTRAQRVMASTVAAVAVAFWLVGYRPQQTRMRVLVSEIATGQRALDASQSQAVHLPDVAADLARLKIKLADFQQLPASPDLGEFTSQITQLCHKSGLSKIEVNFPGTSQHSENFGQRPVQLKFDGDFMHVFAFLQQAETMPRLTRVTNIAMHGGDLKTGTVHVDVTMNIYFAEG